MKQEIINFLSNKRILVLGFGREGKSAVDFIQKNLPDADFAIADEQDNPDFANLPHFFGPDYLDHCKDFDIVIKSPGVVIKDYLADAELAKITSLTDLFLRFCPNPIVGITGTKGKSTTSSLIYHILKENHREAELVGNIGRPCFDVIDDLRVDTTVVFELSCHQLEFVQASPHIAILLNLYQEHLDHYLSAEHYFAAKKNIFRHQKATDYLIYGDIFKHCSIEEIEHTPAENKYDIYKTAPVPADSIHSHLLGEHNLRDIYAAIYACRALELTDEEILSAIATFRGLPHRLEYVGKFKNIDFYNDSIATAQEAAIAAVKAVKNVDTIILGGMDRGLDYHPIVDFLRSSNVRNVLLLPNTEQSFQRIFNEAPFSQNLVYCETLEEAVKTAYAMTAEYHSCLLSPAAASYNSFKNFEERGQKFCEYVKKYAAV